MIHICVGQLSKKWQNTSIKTLMLSTQKTIPIWHSTICATWNSRCFNSHHKWYYLFTNFPIYHSFLHSLLLLHLCTLIIQTTNYHLQFHIPSITPHNLCFYLIFYYIHSKNNKKVVTFKDILHQHTWSWCFQVWKCTLQAVSSLRLCNVHVLR